MAIVEPSAVIPGPQEERRESLLSRVLRYSLTGPDDRTFELAELMIGFGFLVGVLLEVADFILQWVNSTSDSSFNFFTYMSALGLGAGAITAAQRLRDGRTGGGS